MSQKNHGVFILLALGLALPIRAKAEDLPKDIKANNANEIEETSEDLELRARKMKRYDGSQENKTDAGTEATHPESKRVYDSEKSIIPDAKMDWRAKLSEEGIDFAVLYKGEVSRTVSGGQKQANSFLGNLDLKVTIDGDKLFGWKDFQIFAYGLADHGQKPSENAATAYGVSNIEVADRLLKLYEIWVQQTFFDSRLSILAGIHDLNSEFYVTDSSGLFFNPAFGIGNDLAQTGTNGPAIFPSASPALRLQYAPRKDFSIMTAAFNGEAGDSRAPTSSRYRINQKDGALLIHEIAYLPEFGESRSKYAAGYWSYTNKQESAFAADRKKIDQGYYVLVNQILSETLSGFVRYGEADEDLHEVKSNWSTGVVQKSPFASRSDDDVGLAFTQIEKSSELLTEDESRQAPTTSVTELTYRVSIKDGFALQPNIQYFDYPGNDHSPRSSTVIGLRVELGL